MDNFRDLVLDGFEKLAQAEMAGPYGAPASDFARYKPADAAKWAGQYVVKATGEIISRREHDKRRGSTAIGQKAAEKRMRDRLAQTGLRITRLEAIIAYEDDEHSDKDRRRTMRPREEPVGLAPGTQDLRDLLAALRTGDANAIVDAFQNGLIGSWWHQTADVYIGECFALEFAPGFAEGFGVA